MNRLQIRLTFNVGASNPGRDEMNHYARTHNFLSMFEDGLDHVLNGRTTIEEISRVVNN